jgi:hypothetical protein
MPNSLDEQSPEFDERNLFLFLTLGLLSLGDRLERLLRSHAPERATDGRRGPAPEQEPLAYLLLGAIRLHDVIQRELRGAACERHASSASPPPEMPASAPAGDLLR